MHKRVAFYTLGCKVNAVESDVLAATFKQRGYKLVDFKEKSDIYVINTCTVTHQADAQCRKIIRQARKKSPEAVVAVIGCYAQADPHAISMLPGVDLILGNGEKYAIFEHLNNNFCPEGDTSCFTEPVIRTDFRVNPFEGEKEMSYGTLRTRAFLKVQDGCSYKCSYCIIPFVRGPSICRDKNDVLNRAKAIRDAGFKEIVITAINLGEYRNGSGYKLINLLEDLCAVPDVPRVRLTSIEPNCISEELIKFIAGSGVICPHFHVPLQSGSDTVLNKMRRKYLTKKYARVMEWITTHVHDAAVGADVMVGFPGETDVLFEESAAFVREMPVTYLHVFRYSPRSGTHALNFSYTIPPQVSHARSQKMIGIGLKKKEKFLQNQVGKKVEVLFESNRNNGGYKGFTRNYVRVQCHDAAKANSLEQVLITGKSGFVLKGNVVS